MFVIFLCMLVFLVGCNNSSVVEVDVDSWISDEGFSVEETFNQQMEKAQYIEDLTDFISYDLALLSGNIPFISDFSFSAEFDEKSSIQGGINFSQKEVAKAQNLQSSDIDFVVKAEKQEGDSEPFDLSGSVTLLYKDGEMYANLHDLGVFMGEGNMVAKMYTLLGDLLVDNWVNLEVHSGGIISVDEKVDERLPYISGTVKNVFKTKDIQSSPNFLGSVAELLDTINSYIDLGISTDELSIINHEISYVELSDKTIQKYFTGIFQGKDSAFDLSFVVSKNGFDLHLYNIREYDEEIGDYKDIEQECLFTILENKASEYSVLFELLKTQQKVVDFKGKIEYGNMVHFLGDFVLEPLELIAGQKISGKIDGNIVKKVLDGDIEMPELTGNVLLRSELMASL